MRDDGRRVGRFSVPRWIFRAAIGLASAVLVANVALVTDYTLVRRGHVAAPLIAASNETGPQEAPVDPRAGERRVASAETSRPVPDQGPSDKPESQPAPDPLVSARAELAAVRQQLAAAREQLATKSKALEPIERRLAEFRDEVRGWDGLHAAILNPLSGERRIKAAATERRMKTDGSSLDTITALLTRVREESHRLRALAVVTREAAAIISAVPSRLPLRAAINSGFGMRADPFGGAPQFHAGIDFAARTGTPVAAAAGGIVLVAGTASGYGNTVVLDHGRGFETRYGHLDVIRVEKGQRVERGQPIGLSGNTGRSTAPHLHYEVLVDGRPVDPRRLLRD